MRGAPGRCNPARVDGSHPRLVVELEPGEPVCGWVAREGGPRTRFEGMLGLLSLFEHLRRDEDAAVLDATEEWPSREH